MDIFKDIITDHTEDGVPFVVRSPIDGQVFGEANLETGKVEKPFTLILLGLKAPPVQAFGVRFRKLHSAKEFTPAEDKEWRDGLAASAAIGWENHPSGTQFSKSGFADLCALQSWLPGKVIAFLNDEANFLSL